MSRWARRLGFRCAATVAAAVFVLGCQGGSADSANAANGDVTLPGLEPDDLTPRERHEFSRYVTQFVAPCPGEAETIAECVLQKRPCSKCAAAASAIATSVREGMSHEQVESLFSARFDPAGAKVVPVDGSPARGPENAPVTVVEFADFECPFCQRIAPVLDAMWEKRRTSVRLVYKFMPLVMHPHSEIAASAAIAADLQGKFWPMHDQLFENGTRLEQSDIDGYARALGLDMNRFHSDLSSPVVKARLDSDRKLADDLGVRATPTIFINGRPFDTQANLDDWVDGEIAAAK